MAARLHVTGSGLREEERYMKEALKIGRAHV